VALLAKWTTWCTLGERVVTSDDGDDKKERVERDQREQQHDRRGREGIVCVVVGMRRSR
jgi:hypothetical protein